MAYRTPIRTARRNMRPSADAGAYRGSISTWFGPQITNNDEEATERKVATRRVQDLYTNDWAAYSAVNTISQNAVGTGLCPQLQIPHKLLGISQEEGKELQQTMEWAWYLWTSQAHSKGITYFEDLQYAGLLSILRTGEIVHLPVSLPLDNERTFSLTVQDISPMRLCTPLDKLTDTHIVDGVFLDDYVLVLPIMRLVTLL